MLTIDFIKYKLQNKIQKSVIKDTDFNFKRIKLTCLLTIHAETLNEEREQACNPVYDLVITRFETKHDRVQSYLSKLNISHPKPEIF